MAGWQVDSVRGQEDGGGPGAGRDGALEGGSTWVVRYRRRSGRTGATDRSACRATAVRRPSATLIRPALGGRECPAYRRHRAATAGMPLISAAGGTRRCGGETRFAGGRSGVASASGMPGEAGSRGDGSTEKRQGSSEISRERQEQRESTRMAYLCRKLHPIAQDCCAFYGRPGSWRLWRVGCKFKLWELFEYAVP